MQHSRDPSPPTGSANLEALLLEGPWLQSLAQGLIGEDAGPDLAQDVVRAALEKPPGLAGPPLRGWLRTVAERGALRWRQRACRRVAVERAAARPESEKDQARTRLALHRKLSAAIDDLKPIYRTALILRYLEGLPPRKIALRLGIPVTAARKRVSRGLEQLRERLDQEFDGGRSTWGLALASFLERGGSAGPAQSISQTVPVATSGNLISNLSFSTCIAMSLKPILLASACLLTALYVIHLSIEENDVGPLDRGTAGQPLGLERFAQNTDLEIPEALISVRTDVPIPGGNEGIDLVHASPRRLFVVDASGKPQPQAKAAWVDNAGHVLALALDPDASAILPLDLSDARFFAYAPGFSTASKSLESTENSADITLILLLGNKLRGRVVEDEGPPPATNRPFCNDRSSAAWYSLK